MYGQGSGSSSRSGGANDNEGGDADRRSTAELLAAREKEIDEMRRRLHELENFDKELRQFTAPEEEPEAAIEAAAVAEKAEVDARSIYVGNVDYACSPEDVQQHFQFCGTINRVTILTDSYGQPKGFAYVEFGEAEAVQGALLLNDTELYGRPLKVSRKRTNIPGMRRSREWQPFHPFSPYYPEYGPAPRFRRSWGYNPY